MTTVPTSTWQPPELRGSNITDHDERKAEIVKRGLRVAVIGAGPSGLSAALLLQDKGVNVRIYERREGTVELPQAHQVNTRTSEIFDQLGVYERIRDGGAPRERARYAGWWESLAGQCLGIQDILCDLSISACRALNVGQDVVERVLAEELTSRGTVVHFGHEVVDSRRNGEAAELDIRQPDGTVTSETFEIVLVCDGASSETRKRLGIEMEGPPSLARFVSCYFEADLGPYYEQSPGPVRFINGPDVRGAVIGFTMDRVWAFMCAKPDDVDLSAYTTQVMQEVLRRVIGDADVSARILSIGTWNMSAQVATSFRNGPFFLVGDAAHRFPPTGGLGLNTGVQDAHNLAWKIALIDRGYATDALLDTYETERRPVAQLNCQQSVDNAVGMFNVDAVIGSPTLAPLPPDIVDTLPSAPRFNLADPDTPARAAAVQDAVDAFSGAMDWARIDLGFCYSLDGASEDDHAPSADPDSGPWRAVARPGALLPHVWLEGPDRRTAAAGVISTDTPTLFVPASDSAWLATADSAAASSQLPLHHVSVDAWSTGSRNEWCSAMGVGLDGAMLVRPDGHIAWLSPDGPDARSEATLKDAIHAMTGAQ
jgi:2-polyprenyl-6-methoxyphenol hydroxylase-like FAD-dependent oxidoreductase